MLPFARKLQVHLAALGAAAVFTGCGGGQPAAPSEELASLVDEYFERYIELNPLTATAIGDHRWDDRLPNNIGSDHRIEEEALEREFLARIEQIDPDTLNAQDLLTWEVFNRERSLAVEGFQYPSWLLPVNQFSSLPNSFAQLGSGENIQPFATVKNYEDFLGRMDDFSVWVDQAIENMRSGIAQGYVNPRVLMERTLPQLAAHVVDDVTESIFYRPVANFPDSIGEEDRARLTGLYETAIRETVIPAYRRLHDYIENEYLPATRTTDGMGALPDGDEWYAYRTRVITTTDLTPDEIHRIGLDEVERIHAEMDRTIAEVGFVGNRSDFFQFLKNNPKFYYTERENLINGYRSLRDRVEKGVPNLFSRFPEADFEIRAVEPFRERSAAGGSYQRPAPDGSRPGIFYANAYDLSSRPIWAMESLFLHEAVPGHHFQIALQQEIDGMPRFRRFGGQTAYIEGWALYAESLGRELGVYTDPYQYFGSLDAELWRAVRLVVDTGLHSKGWSRQDVLDYMFENTAEGEASAIAEAERYMAIPGQALAYKIGQMRIRALRTRAEATLGPRFDVKAFHEAVLADGSLPLDVLEEKINRWIQEQ